MMLKDNSIPFITRDQVAGSGAGAAGRRAGGAADGTAVSANCAW